MNKHVLPPGTGAKMPRVQRRALSVIAVVAALGGFAGCGASSSSPAATATTGGGTPASGSPGSPASSAAGTSATTAGHSAAGGCALITEQEATAALGADPGPGMPQSLAQGSVTSRTCIYNGSDLVVTAETPFSRANYDSSKAAVPHGATIKDLTGVGDGAYIHYDSISAGCVVFKGSVGGTVTVIPRAPLASPAGTVTTLCKALAGRL